MKPIIEVGNVMKHFVVGKEQVDILKNINFDVYRGDFVSIMGPSGSGKSTLLYLLGGLDKPNAGTILVEQQRLEEMSDKQESMLRRRSIGFVFQFYNLIPNLTVEENILMPILLDGKKARDYKQQLSEILSIVGLENRRHYTPRELSGGQQQRTAIARALINDPEIILADEPIGNLDSKSGLEIMELFQKINRENQKTIIQVTHSLQSATYGNRKITIKDGMIQSA